MTPPTIPPWSAPLGDMQIVNIIIEALRQDGYDAGIASNESEWKDFDINMYRGGGIVIGSKKRNKTWLNVFYDKQTIMFRVIGHAYWPNKARFSQSGDSDNFNLADPNALKNISNYIVDVVNNDWYHYPWI